MWRHHRFPTACTSCVKIGEVFPQGFHTSAERGVLCEQRVDALEAVDDSRVIASAEGVADFDELEAQEFANEEHRDLPRHGELLGAALGAQAFDVDAEFPRDELLNREDAQSVLFFGRRLAI